MKIISHRGNTDGKNYNLENNPEQIKKVIEMGFDCEVDLRIKDGDLYLGHDFPQYKIDYKWLLKNKYKLWVHAKDHESVNFLRKTKLNWFWHDKDDMTLTSYGFIWSNTDKYFNNGITVCPDYQDLPSNLLGVCTDEPMKFKQ